ncbi:glycine cleavage system H protein [Clostridium tepidiprofundi DSM 19306]|uniref:Glycine cleavage system H protein n=1 Tax=Clostridium tepidiprofundi DSM 19306 TaxID=1121338 RepID=A0A151B6K4_9CLOT|nr:putative zinc-binding protein [Clostridium tepidiprofundi]KYH35277.1 glycine cleavage system H protein [Clostridium tepidiprofundi DSM 19306]
MSKKYSILPCNGLDKCAGCVSREIAIKISEQSESEIICPVLYRVADARYNKIAEENPLLVIDGCATRCASKLAAEKGLKVAKKINVTEEAKNKNISINKDLRIGSEESKLIDLLTEEILKGEEKNENKEQSNVSFPENIEYEIYKKDKFIFRVPKEGFYFNENDCWVYIVGNIARIGVTDYVQQSLSDIMFFNPPAFDSEVEQFGELGTIESGKAVFEIVSPVSGKVISINDDIISAPELINENPYEKGWIAEVELTNIDEDRDFLLNFDEYFEILKRKVDEFHV